MSTPELFWFVNKPDIANQVIGYIGKSKGDGKAAFEAKCEELMAQAFGEEAPNPAALVSELLASVSAVFTEDADDDAGTSAGLG